MPVARKTGAKGLLVLVLSRPGNASNEDSLREINPSLHNINFHLSVYPWMNRRAEADDNSQVDFLVKKNHLHRNFFHESIFPALKIPKCVYSGEYGDSQNTN